MSRENIICTQVRLPEELHKKIKSESKEMNVPFNSHLIELLYMGLKVQNSSVILRLPEE